MFSSHSTTTSGSLREAFISFSANGCLEPKRTMAKTKPSPRGQSEGTISQGISIPRKYTSNRGWWWLVAAFLRKEWSSFAILCLLWWASNIISICSKGSSLRELVKSTIYINNYKYMYTLYTSLIALTCPVHLPPAKKWHEITCGCDYSHFSSSGGKVLQHGVNLKYRWLQTSPARFLVHVSKASGQLMHFNVQISINPEVFHVC